MSGIYISKLEMPKDGEFIIVRSDGESYYVSKSPKEAKKGHAIPVPYHGRLIDADALCKAMSDYDWGQDSYWDEAAVGLVCDAPTIIPADKEAGE